MFTGIIEELGTVHDVHEQTDAVRLTVHSTQLLDGVRLGDSIAVNGCCLTVAATASSTPGGPVDLWVADVMAESLARTTLGALRAGDRVNLERAVTADARLGGHVVQGHVDGVGTVIARRPGDHWEIVEFSVPDALAALLVEKGSITVDGTSLTVVDVTRHGASPGREAHTTFTVSLIPETLARTTLGTRTEGEQVNLESDVLARHVAKIVEQIVEEQVASQLEALVNAAVARALNAVEVTA